MELIQIDALHAEPSQRRVAFGTNGFRLEDSLRLSHAIPFIPDQATLGKDVRPFGSRQRAHKTPDNFFGMTQTVNRGRIDPVDTQLNGAAHRIF